MTPDLERSLREAGDTVRVWTVRRDHLIVDAVEAGVSLRVVARAVGLSHGTVANIVARVRQDAAVEKARSHDGPLP